MFLLQPCLGSLTMVPWTLNILKLLAIAVTGTWSCLEMVLSKTISCSFKHQGAIFLLFSMWIGWTTYNIEDTCDTKNYSKPEAFRCARQKLLISALFRKNGALFQWGVIVPALLATCDLNTLNLDADFLSFLSVCLRYFAIISSQSEVVRLLYTKTSCPVV